MTAITRPLKVAIVGTNNDSMYSGGRYHALIMAYALARSGQELTFITNKKPRFFDDLEPLAPGDIRYVYTGDFRTNMPKESFDFVVLVPTGIFLPGFYEAVFEFARASDARLALVNFESGNWFNAVSGTPRDLRLWEYWRRAVADGGLVISSLRVSDAHARDFYRASAPGSLRFEVCGPPINSPAADLGRDLAKDGSVVTFVRSSDPHKGGQDLLALPAEHLRGRDLKVIAGGPVDPEFQAALQAHYLAGGARVEFHTAVSDVRKFELIAQAQAVLFPSRFEGFGYPPVEAAYSGTEVVCYDLPVLLETVGNVARMSPVGDVEALGAALAQALEMPERRDDLRAGVCDLVGIDAVGLRMTDILLRSHDAVPPLPQVQGKVLWGPFQTDEADPAVQTVPPMPTMLRSYRRTAAGGAILSVRMCCPEIPARLDVATSEQTAEDLCLLPRGFRSGWPVFDVIGHFQQQPPASDRLDIRALDAGGGLLVEGSLSLTEAAAEAPAVLSMTGLWSDGQGSRVRFRRRGAADRLVLSCDGRTWQEAEFDGDSVSLQLAETKPYLRGLSAYLCDGHDVIGYFAGCPPRAAQRPAAPGELPQGTFKIVDLDDAYWARGVLRSPNGKGVGVIVCQGSDRVPSPASGDVVRLVSGRLLRVHAVEPKGDLMNLHFSVPIDPVSEGAPNTLTLLARGSGPAPRQDEAPWMGGVWRGAGDFSGRCVELTADQVEALGEGPHALLCSDGQQIAIEKIWHGSTASTAWLAAPLTSTGRFEVIRALRPVDLRLCDGTDAQALPPEPLWECAPQAGRVVALRARAAPQPGDALVFGPGHLRNVQACHAQDDLLYLLLDLGLPKGADGSVRFSSTREQIDLGLLQMQYPGRVTSPGVSKLMGIAEEFRTSHPALPLMPVSGRPRVLFASIVPPDPADQGNRIVTRNFISHLVAQGFDVDLLLIGRVAPESIAQQYGDRVRVFSWMFPDWASEPSAAMRQRVIDEIRALNPAPMEQGTFDAMLREAATYHPFFIVPDPIVRIARALYRTHDYHSIVCNYTHMIKVACELAPIRPLPPVAVVTHDALSRLPLEFDGKPVNTMYRLCDPQTERDVLDAVPGAVVLAISSSEQAYFREIGVKNPVALCEYDGLQECSQYRVHAEAFEGRRLLFHASGNPMNRVAIDWFLENCWDRVRAAVPAAKLVICGGICKQIDKGIPGVELHGIVGRDRLMELLGTSSVAINPTLVGTGLKIKTVEAACAGLPSVCLPPAIEGLETVADRFCLLETEPEGFAQACVRLLSDQAFWTRMHHSALALAAERFSAQAIYGAVDRHMGWDQDVEDRLQAPRRCYEVSPQAGLAELARSLPQPARDRCVLVAQVEELGEFQAANRLFADVLKDFGRSDAVVLAQAARLAANVGNLQGAMRAGGELHANCPADGSVLVTMARAAAAAGETSLAADIWQVMALAMPASQVTCDLADELGLESAQRAASEWAATPIAVCLNSRTALTERVAIGETLGLGWSRMEKWGCWSDGPFARLRLQFEDCSDPLRICLEGHALRETVKEPLSIRLVVDGDDFGRFVISNDARGEIVALDIPAADGPRSALQIDLMIENPSPVRGPDGSLRDRRQLGLALVAIGCSTRPA